MIQFSFNYNMKKNILCWELTSKVLKTLPFKFYSGNVKGASQKLRILFESTLDSVESKLIGKTTQGIKHLNKKNRS